MLMFLSSFYGIIDSKKRVAIPSSFRSTINSTKEKIFIFKSLKYECLEVHLSSKITSLVKSFEEKDAKAISKNIINVRESKKIDTQELVRIIERSKRKRSYKVHCATKTFQALRIFVNNEISELINGLINSVKILKKDGVLAVVTFHSLEDKIVKYFFKSLSEHKSISRYEPKIQQKNISFKMPLKKPIVPSDKEIKENTPSRSAKLRYIIKNENIYEIETDILEKFSHLLEVENLGLKL